MIGITCKAANNLKVVELKDGKEVTRVTRDAMPLLKLARAAAKAQVKKDRLQKILELSAQKAARELDDKKKRSEERSRKKETEHAQLLEHRSKAAVLLSTAKALQEHTLLSDRSELTWWLNLDEGIQAARQQQASSEDYDASIDALFEPEMAVDSEMFEPEVADDDGVMDFVTRSQEDLAAGSGDAEPVVGAEAPYPVTARRLTKKTADPVHTRSLTQPATGKQGDEKKAIFASGAEKKANLDELWKQIRVSEAVSQLPTAATPAGEVNEKFRTPQQLNAQKQNRRRSLEKAQARTARGSDSAESSAKRKSSESQVASLPRVYDAVADFWGKKKARLALLNTST